HAPYDVNTLSLHDALPISVDDSYGIQVAKLADLPDEVISRAQVILDAFEEHNMQKQATNEEVNLIKNGIDAQPLEDDLVEESAMTYKEKVQDDTQSQFEQAAFDLFETPVKQSEVESEIKQLNLST